MTCIIYLHASFLGIDGNGAQWLSGRVLDLRPKGRGFEPHHAVSLSKNINPSLVLVQPRKTRPFITERLLMGRKESIQTKSLMAKTTAQSVCKNNWLFVCLYKSLPSTCFVLLYNFLFMCNAFVSVWRSKIFFRKSCVDFNFISLIHSYVIKNHIYITPVIIWPCHILFSENNHQLFKHWLLKLSKISWLHVLNVLFFHPIS